MGENFLSDDGIFQKCVTSKNLLFSKECFIKRGKIKIK